MGGAMTTVKGGGWAHLSCVFWHEKPTFENIMQVLFGARCFGFYVVPCCFEHAVVSAALRALVLNIFVCYRALVLKNITLSCAA
jgi:hypothetical protein